MKKVIITLFSCILTGYILSSCEDTPRDDIYCWEFVATIKGVWNDNSILEESSFVRCDLTESQAERIRKSWEHTAVSKDNSLAIKLIKSKIDAHTSHSDDSHMGEVNVDQIKNDIIGTWVEDRTANDPNPSDYVSYYVFETDGARAGEIKLDHKGPINHGKQLAFFMTIEPHNQHIAIVLRYASHFDSKQTTLIYCHFQEISTNRLITSDGMVYRRYDE